MHLWFVHDTRRYTNVFWLIEHTSTANCQKTSKVSVALHRIGISSQSYGGSPAIWDHSVVTCYPMHVNAPHLNPSQAGQYWIHLPRRDGRLSWPWWLVVYQDGLPVHRWWQSPTGLSTNHWSQASTHDLLIIHKFHALSLSHQQTVCTEAYFQRLFTIVEWSTTKYRLLKRE